MSDPYDLARSKIADALEHEDTTEPKTKRVLAYGWDSDNLTKRRIATDENGQLKVTGASAAETVGLKNVADDQINPATEDKQDDIITAIGAIPGGGGEQYADGTAVDPGYKGTIALGTDGSNYQMLATDSSGNLRVDVNNMVDVSGLALESGGNLDTIAGDTSSIDGKITACDTTGLAVESGGNLDTIAGDTTSIDGKITTCDTSSIAGTVTAEQATHDSLNANANIQVGDADVANGNPVPISDAGGAITVDGTVTATPSGVQEIEGDEAESSGNLPQPVLIGGDDGTDIKNINVDATTGDVQVDVTSIAAGSNNIGDVDVASIAAGTNYIGKTRLTDGTNDTSVTNAGLFVTGDEANDAADAGNPVKIGGKAFTSMPTAVAGNDRTDGFFDVYGRFVNTESVPDTLKKHVAYAVSSAGTVTVLDPTNGYRFVLCDVIISTDTAMNVTVFDNTDSAANWIVEGYFAQYGGMAHSYKLPFVSGAVNNLLKMTTSAAGNVTISITYYETL